MDDVAARNVWGSHRPFRSVNLIFLTLVVRFLNLPVATLPHIKSLAYNTLPHIQYHRVHAKYHAYEVSCVNLSRCSRCNNRPSCCLSVNGSLIGGGGDGGGGFWLKPGYSSVLRWLVGRSIGRKYKER